MTDGSSYELILTPPAVRVIRSGLPEAVAAAVTEFLTGALDENHVGSASRSE
jgi:mRNA interferase RelE/StbE